MSKIILLSISFLCLISCTKKEEYECVKDYGSDYKKLRETYTIFETPKGVKKHEKQHSKNDNNPIDLLYDNEINVKCTLK